MACGETNWGKAGSSRHVLAKGSNRISLGQHERICAHSSGSRVRPTWTLRVVALGNLGACMLLNRSLRLGGEAGVVEALAPLPRMLNRYTI